MRLQLSSDHAPFRAPRACAQVRLLERRVFSLVQHCLRCTAAHDGPLECRNLDCPHLYSRVKLERQHATAAEHLRLAAPRPETAARPEGESRDATDLDW